MQSLSSPSSLRPLPWLALSLAATLSIGQANAEPLTSGEHSVQITVNEVAMLGFSDTTPLAFEVIAPTQAGVSPFVQIHGSNSRQLFFTSVVDSDQIQRVIRVSHGDTVPNGLRLTLQAGVVLGMGAVGNTNTGAFSTATQINGTGNQVVVNGIGTGYTSTNPDEGVTLNYGLSLSNSTNEISTLRAQNNTATLTFTMSAE